MANTLADLRAQIRLVLASTDDWANATLDKFIADAIRFYSAEFPRRWRYSQAMTTGTQAYNVPGAHGFQQILSVEYPTGEDPQSFLTEVNEWDSDFQNAGDVYALRGISDITAIESDTAAATIVFAETVTTGESAVVEYEGLHAIPTAGDDDAQITVPVHHWEALYAFADFRAHWELESDLAATVSTISIVLAQLGQEARYAWNRYKEVMNALVAQRSKSVIISWAEQDSVQKRVY